MGTKETMKSKSFDYSYLKQFAALVVERSEVKKINYAIFFNEKRGFSIIRADLNRYRQMVEAGASNIVGVYSPTSTKAEIEKDLIKVCEQNFIKIKHERLQILHL